MFRLADEVLGKPMSAAAMVRRWRRELVARGGGGGVWRESMPSAVSGSRQSVELRRRQERNGGTVLRLKVVMARDEESCTSSALGTSGGGDGQAWGKTNWQRGYNKEKGERVWSGGIDPSLTKDANTSAADWPTSKKKWLTAVNGDLRTSWRCTPNWGREEGDSVVQLGGDTS